MGANADIVRRLTDQGFIGGDLSVIDELISADFLSHDPPPMIPGTRDGLRQIAAIVAGGASDRKMDFDDFVDTADGRVVESWAMTARHTGELFGLPATGQTFRVRGVEIWRCAGGKIVEHWGAVDMSDLFEKAQLA
jgi:predicted SnoaL-like aldol condensation-catalyzing enzyme